MYFYISIFNWPFIGKAGTGMDREVSLTLKHGAEAKDYEKVHLFIL